MKLIKNNNIELAKSNNNILKTFSKRALSGFASNINKVYVK